MRLTDMIPQTFTKEDAAAAVKFLRVRYGKDPHWQSALDKAWESLERRKWQWDGSTLLIASATNTRQRYFVTEAGCQCKAAKFDNICSHMAARHIVSTAAQLAPPF